MKNQYGQIVRSAITEEEISAKTGVLSWNLANMSLLSTGVYTEDKEGKKKDLIFTGDGKALKTVLLRAVHTKENGKKIRFTMIGQGGSGFAITWENKEVTIDAELTAIKKVKGFLASLKKNLRTKKRRRLSRHRRAQYGVRFRSIHEQFRENKAVWERI